MAVEKDEEDFEKDKDKGEKEESKLLKRLESLEKELEKSKKGAEKKSFMDKFGSKFSGDEGIGTAILAQLNRRGIDTSAADEAVQEIIDNLREEATALLDKLNSISDAVEEAVGGSGGGDESPADAGGEAPPPDAGGAPPPDAGGAPPPPPDAGGAPPPDAGGAPPPDAGGAPPPGGVPSDINLKDIDNQEPDEALESAKKDEGLETTEGEEKESKPNEEPEGPDEPTDEEEDDEFVPFKELTKKIQPFEDELDIEFDPEELEDIVAKVLTAYKGRH